MVLFGQNKMIPTIVGFDPHTALHLCEMPVEPILIYTTPNEMRIRLMLRNNSYICIFQTCITFSFYTIKVQNVVEGLNRLV